MSARVQRGRIVRPGGSLARRDYEERLGSYHEAGHAVADELLGAGVERVTMHECIRAGDVDDWSKVVAACAGSVGARIGNFMRFTGLSRGMSEQDLAIADVALERMGLGRSALDRAKTEAKALLWDNERALHRVAEALRAKGELTGDEVSRLVAGASVEEVLASPTRAADPTLDPDRPAPDGFRAFVYRAWPISSGGWCATLEPGHAVEASLRQLEAVGATEDEAIAELAAQTRAAIGGAPIELRPARASAA